MRACYFILFSILFWSCKKETNFRLQELQEGSWLFLKVENQENQNILDGSGEPKILLFFKDNNEVVGRLKGNYTLTGNNLYLQLEIDTLALNRWSAQGGVYDELDAFPQRYYDFEAITQNGISGNVTFYENGWDSRFSIEYEPGKFMWFERY